jgi:hypothetical protein
MFEQVYKLGTFAVLQPSSRPIDALKIFEQAHGFYQALAILCNIDPGNTALAVTIGEPVMVIGAFTIELFLKCLIYIESGSLPRREHDLKKLFDELSPEIQVRIEKEWEKIAEHHAEVWDSFEKSFGITMARDLRSALAAGGDAFRPIRYSYEGGNETLQFYLQDLPRALGRIVLELKPEWTGHTRDYRPLPGWRTG